MDCPNCSSEMALVRAGEVTVEHCEDCDAFWFDIEEINRFVEVAATVTASRNSGGDQGRNGRVGLGPPISFPGQRQRQESDDALDSGHLDVAESNSCRRIISPHPFPHRFESIA